jgi:hypothetical protein
MLRRYGMLEVYITSSSSSSLLFSSSSQYFSTAELQKRTIRL